MPGLQSRSPAFVKINYSSEFAPHTMELPTLAWSNASSTHGHGRFSIHSGGDIDAQDMIEDLVTVLLPAFPASVSFDNWTIFTQATPTSDPVPVESEVFTAMAGSAGTPGWYKAVTRTFNFRSENFGLAKLVLLDAASFNGFDKLTVTTNVDLLAIITEYESAAKGWSAQDNGRPATLISMTTNLNQKLRKSYRMA